MLITFLFTFIVTHASFINEFVGNLNAVVHDYPTSYAISTDTGCFFYDTAANPVEISCGDILAHRFTHKCNGDEGVLYLYNYSSEIDASNMTVINGSRSKVKFYNLSGDLLAYGKCVLISSRKQMITIMDLVVLLMLYVAYDNPRFRRGYLSYAYYFAISVCVVTVYKRFSFLL